MTANLPPSTPLANRDLMRAINRSTILAVIKNSGPIARAEVARRTGLSPATVTGITAELIEEGLVYEKEPGDSRGGRRPILLAVNPEGGYVIGVKLTETHAVAALTDLEAAVVEKGERTLSDRTPEAVTQTLVDLSNDLLNTPGLPSRRLLGIGIGLAGIVDARRGVLRQSPFFGWTDLPLRDLLQARFSVPVTIENDVNTLTLAEKLFGAGQDVDNFLVVTLGRGVGMGIVVNGQFYRGAGGGAGEFGHIQPGLHFGASGRACECGKTGCLETYVSDPALLAGAGEAYQRGQLPVPVQTISELLDLAQAGQPAAIALLQEAGTALGAALANLVNLFNPQRIILGGEGVGRGDLFFEAVRAALRSGAMSVLLSDLDLRIEPWGDDAWARGAASLVLRELFESPIQAQA